MTPNKIIDTKTGYCKIYKDNGDIIEYALIYEIDPRMVTNPKQLDNEIIDKVLAILKKENVTEFKVNLQLYDTK